MLRAYLDVVDGLDVERISHGEDDRTIVVADRNREAPARNSARESWLRPHGRWGSVVGLMYWNPFWSARVRAIISSSSDKLANEHLPSFPPSWACTASASASCSSVMRSGLQQQIAEAFTRVRHRASLGASASDAERPLDNKYDPHCYGPADIKLTAVRCADPSEPNGSVISETKRR